HPRPRHRTAHRRRRRRRARRRAQDDLARPDRRRRGRRLRDRSRRLRAQPPRSGRSRADPGAVRADWKRRMKYVTEFRDGALAAAIAREVEPGRDYAFMEFCGGHTHAISRYGVADLLPANVRLIHGPGCPVCVLPVGRVDMAIRLALARPEVILCTYADCLRVPASDGLSLLKAKARGADVR